MATSLSFKLIQRRALYENRHRDTMINRCIQEIASLTKEITVKMVWLFALSGVLLASESMADDKEDVVGAIEQAWKDIALKNPTPEGHPDGWWVATSEGGLWQFLSKEEFGAMITESPNVLDFDPHHINVRMVGEKQDVAYAAYYLVGNILDADRKVIVKNYRTRASQVWVKLDGRWVEIGSHYSPLYGGPGVVLD